MRVIGLGTDGLESVMAPDVIRLASETFTHYFLSAAPLDPELMDRWTDTTTGITYTRYQNTWVELGPSYNLEFTTGAPENLEIPVTFGGSRVGDNLSVTTGTWSITPTDITYQWQRYDISEWVNVPITIATYENIPIGTYRAVVTAYNGLASSSAASSATTITEHSGSSFIFDGPASANALKLYEDQVEVDGPADFATAWVATPIDGKSYFEIRFRGTPEASILFSGNGNMPTSTTVNPILLWNQPNALIRTEAWSLSHRANYGMGTNETLGTVIEYDEATEDVILRICVDTTSRRVWVTTAGRTFTGNPMTGISPNFTLNGTAPIHIGVLVGTNAIANIIPVDDHTGPMPGSYSAI